MKYTEDEFFRLMAEVQKQGGYHVDETHKDVYHKSFTGNLTTEGVPPDGTIGYCNNNALFKVPYIGSDKKITVCAVDDCMGLWPRFSDAQAPGSDHSYPAKVQ